MKLTVSGLDFYYGEKQVLKDLSFHVRQGEFVSMLGASGGGKSTVLNLLSGMLKPDGGTILVDDKPVVSNGETFAYMPQEDLLFPWKTVLQNVCLYGQIHKEQAKAEAEALSYLPAFGLEGYEHAYPDSLSGGMRQRAAFLRTALCRAPILLLDEPFGALDVMTRGQMQDWLQSMKKKLNRTVLLVTHDMDEAIYLSDRILILGGSPATVIREFVIDQKERDRDWLYRQGEQRLEIDREIRTYAGDTTL